MNVQKDPTNIVLVGFILIVLGLTLYLALTKIILWEKWWTYFLIGLGVAFILTAILKIVVVANHAQALGYMIGGIIILFVGVQTMIGVKEWWPLILVAIGIAIVIHGLTRM